MKRIIAIFSLVCVLSFSFLFNIQNASAAATSDPKSVSLTPSDDNGTDTTSRILLSSGKKFYFTVSNYWYSGHQVQYSIFKNGSEYLTGFVDVNDTKSFSYSWASGEYSLRLYCGSQSNRKTDCSAGGNISVK